VRVGAVGAVGARGCACGLVGACMCVCVRKMCVSVCVCVRESAHVRPGFRSVTVDVLPCTVGCG